MKKSLSMFVLFLGLSTVSFAQSTKGSITYSMEFSSDNPEMAMATSMMEGSTMTTSFMPGKTRTDVSMGMLGKMATVVDDKTQKILILTDMMGMKYAINQDVEEIKKNQESVKYTVENTSETKTINGYKCTKAILKSDDGSEMTGWFTKDIAFSPTGQTYYSNQMPGVPLEFNASMQGMNIAFKSTAVEKSVDKKIFEMEVPEGYEVKTAEELQMMGGGEE